MRCLKRLTLIIAAFLATAVLQLPALAAAPPVKNPQNGPLGVEGQVNGPPPKQAPTITTPANGQSFTSLPLTVDGLCTDNLLVEIFKNGVFAGSAQCAGGSYSIQIDLFSGRNDLIARQYDALNQSSPDSAAVTVTFSNALPQAGPRISLTTAYAKRGADPGTPLSWPVTISGGEGPYAISADWGDGGAPALLSRQSPGDVTLEHTYTQAGVYNVIIKATDKSGVSAFLQLVGVGNGPIQQTAAISSGGPSVTVKKELVWWPLGVLGVLVIVAFWLGSRHQLDVIRDRLRRGERPFN